MATTPLLFTPLTLRSLVLKNRIIMSPMCQYSAIDGVPNDWHQVHLGTRAVGGAGLILTEATGVNPEGRITPSCTGLWNETQMHAFAKILPLIKAHGARVGIQLAHAGRKGSRLAPWLGDGKSEGKAQGKDAWQTVGPSAIPFSPNYDAPRALTIPEINQLIEDFKKSTFLALKAGFETIELHFAHGYLVHEFLSPQSNQRTDEYGGSLENRMRFGLRIAKGVRDVLPEHIPLLVRISASDWVEGGWDIAQSVEFSKQLQAVGVDFIDCSSGGNVPDAKIPAGPGYQVSFSKEIRQKVGVKTGAVGIITEADQAEKILQAGEADAVLLARELLRDPYWPLHAAKKLGVDLSWPKQYERAKR